MKVNEMMSLVGVLNDFTMNLIGANRTTVQSHEEEIKLTLRHIGEYPK